MKLKIIYEPDDFLRKKLIFEGYPNEKILTYETEIIYLDEKIREYLKYIENKNILGDCIFYKENEMHILDLRRVPTNISIRPTWEYSTLFPLYTLEFTKGMSLDFVINEKTLNEAMRLFMEKMKEYEIQNFIAKKQTKRSLENEEEYKKAKLENK